MKKKLNIEQGRAFLYKIILNFWMKLNCPAVLTVIFFFVLYLLKLAVFIYKFSTLIKSTFDSIDFEV